MKKTLNLGKTGSQLNVPNIPNKIASDLSNEPIPESYIFIQFETDNDPFDGGTNIDISIPLGGPSGTSKSKQFTSADNDTLTLPHPSTSDIFNDTTGGLSLDGATSWLGKSLPIAPADDLFKDFVFLYPTSSTQQITYTNSGAISNPGTPVTDLITYDLIDVTHASQTNGYILALPYFSDSSNYQYPDIEFTFNNPNVTNFTFTGLKHVTKIITCDVGGTTISWKVNEILLDTIIECV